MNNKIDCNYLTSQVYLRVPHRILRDKPTFNVDCRLLTRKDAYMPRVLSLANSLSLYNGIVMCSLIEFKQLVTPLFI